MCINPFRITKYLVRGLRVNQDPDYYRHRQQIIEHQFGTLKRQWHIEYTLTRGKEKVLGEVYLAFTTYNLKRSLTILGFETLMSKIAAHLPSISCWKSCFLTHAKLFSFPVSKNRKDSTFSIS
ncbi:MAG: transposase [Flavobacteriales bacterium]|nr:transposase [Flavobacteriales bacterium]